MKRKDLTQGSVLKGILAVALPTIGLSVMHMLYNLTDLFWLGRLDQIGIDSAIVVAGVGTAGFYFWMSDGFALLARVGTSIRVAQRAGAKNEDEVNLYASSGLFFGILLGLFYGTLLFFFAQQAINFFRIDNPEVVSAGVKYLRIVGAFSVVMFTVNVSSGIYNGLGKTKSSFAIVSVGLILNIILDPIFILVLGKAEVGAAWATVISQTVVMLIYLSLFFSKHRVAIVSFSKVKILQIVEIIKLSLPASAHSMLFTSFSMIVGVMVAQYGQNAIAAHRVGSQIESVTWMMGGGISVALSAFIGQNLGAKRLDRVTAGYKAALKITLPYGIVVSVMMFVFAKPLFGAFLNGEDVLREGTVYLQIIAFSQFFMLLEDTMSGMFNGLGKTAIPSTVGIIGNLARIPLAYTLSMVFGLGIIGIWWTLTISCIFKGTTNFILYRITQKKMLKILAQSA